MFTILGEFSVTLEHSKENANESIEPQPPMANNKPNIRQSVSDFTCNLCRNITVEPVTFFYACAMILHTPVIQQYVYSRVSQQHGLSGMPLYETKSSRCDVSDVKDTYANRQTRNLIQAEASFVHLGVVLSASLPSIFMALLLGAWSDKVGRKIIMMLPIIGGVADTVCILITMYASLPVYVLFIGSFINGFCGFFTTMILAVFSYMADVTEESKRALRLGVIEAIAFISGMISHLTSGWWIKHFGFKSPYWLILTLHILNLMYVTFILPETINNPERKTARDLFNKAHFHRIAKVFTEATVDRKWQLVGLLIASAFMMISSIGFGCVIVLYALDAPFCCSPIMIGYFLADSMFVQAIGAMLGFCVLRKCISEIALTQMGFCSIIASLILMALSKTRWMMFIVPLVGGLGGVCMPIIRAKMSRLVKDEDQGALFAAVATVETICTLFGAAIFNSLYSITVRHFEFKGLSFFIMAALMVVPPIIVG
eukprot:gene12162-13417_t